MPRLSIPTKAASPAASAPIPNHNSTKPDVKISATMRIAPSTAQNTQSPSVIAFSLERGGLASDRGAGAGSRSRKFLPLPAAPAPDFARPPHSNSNLKQILHHEPNICRPLGQPPHEVRIPVFSVRHIDSHVVAIARQLFLKIAPDAVQHLKLKFIFSDSFSCRKLNCRIDHLWIMRRDPVIDAA